MSRKLLVSLLLISLIVAGSVRAENVYTGISKEAAAAFSWFDTLGFPDVKDCKYVRVATGHWSQNGIKPRENTYVNGFLLLKKDTNTFTVLALDLLTGVHAENTATTSEYERVYYTELDLCKEAEACLKQLQNPPEKDDTWRRFGRQLPERAEVFVLAWGCARNGLNEIADKLCEQASRMERERNINNGDELSTDTFKEVLQQDIGHAMMWRAVLAFENPSVSRKELLAKFEDIVRKYPNSRHIPQAKDTCTMLKQLIKEDEKHEKTVRKSFDKMTTKEKVAELIFQLRDQNGHQSSQPGSCDIFEDVRRKQSPAGQLVEIGYDAVPQLIATLGDQRFTRSVGFHRDFYFSHYVLRVGDCAEQILSKIANRNFFSPKSTFSYMTKDEQAAETKKLVEQWWADIQKNGEEAILIEATEKGDRDSLAQARKLLEKYPDAALDAIVKGTTSDTQCWSRTELVEIAGSVKGDAAVPFLSQEMKTGPFLSSRVAAAWALHLLGREEAVPAMIGEWRKIDTSKSSPGASEGSDSLVEFLVECDRPAAILALGEDLSKHPVDTRLSVVGKMRENLPFVSSSRMGSWTRTADSEKKRLSVKTQEAAEELLVSLLDDVEERTGMSIGYSDASFTNPRICDVAAYTLTHVWTDKYTFDPSSSPRNRDRQRIACANVWRKSHNLQELPVPKTRTIAPAPKDKTDPLISKIRNAGNAAEVTNELAMLESMGLSALPAVMESLKALPEKHPVRANMTELARKLSCIVAQTNESFKSRAELTALLDGLKGKPLDAGKFVEVILGAISDLPAGIWGVKVTATRNDDLAGIEPVVASILRKAQQSGSQKGWHTCEHVSVGNESILTSSGSSDYEYQLKPEAYDRLAKAIDKALSAQPAEPIEISVSVVLEE